MQQFTRVRAELRTWLTAYQWVNSLLPWCVFILFGSLGIMLLNDILQIFHVYISFLSSLMSAVGWFGFLIGSLCCLISADVKYVPYGFWCYAFLILFPFNYFSVHSVVNTVFWAYLGYLMMRYTSQNTNLDY